MLNYKDYENEENVETEIKSSAENITEIQNDIKSKDGNEEKFGIANEAIVDQTYEASEFENGLDEIGLIRKRQGMNEIEGSLKANVFGGYSKKIVSEYVNAIREQQAKVEERFKKNLKEIFEEKEELKKKWEENQKYILELEEQNSQFYKKVKDADKFDIEGYNNEIKRLEDSLSSALEEKKNLGKDNDSLLANLVIGNKHIEEVESKYKEMTSKLLEMEKIDVDKEREHISLLETNVARLTVELENKNKEIAEYKKQSEYDQNEFKNLKMQYDSIVAANDSNKSLLIEAQKSLLEKENIIAENSNRYEKQMQQLNNQFQSQLSEATKNLESAHKMILEKEQALNATDSLSKAKLTEVEINYQLKLDSMMENLLKKDAQINQLAKSLEENAHFSNLMEHNNKSLKKNADNFKSNLDKSMKKLQEYSEINKSLMRELEDERTRNIEILKEKITLEINYSAKEQKINDLDYEVEVLSKWNEKLTEQMEQERAKAKELISQFAITREVQI